MLIRHNCMLRGEGYEVEGRGQTLNANPKGFGTSETRGIFNLEGFELTLWFPGPLVFWSPAPLVPEKGFKRFWSVFGV